MPEAKHWKQRKDLSRVSGRQTESAGQHEGRRSEEGVSSMGWTSSRKPPNSHATPVDALSMLGRHGDSDELLVHTISFGIFQSHVDYLLILFPR